MINELLIKYKDQQPKNFRDYVERSYPVSAVIAMIEEVQQNFCKPDVSGRSEQLPLDFTVWYSGMDKSKVLKAYERYKVESGNCQYVD